MFLDRLLVFGLIIAGVVLSALGDREHATMMLGGALGAMAPLAARNTTASSLARAFPLALGFGAMALAGCDPASTRVAFKVSEGVCGVVVPACHALEQRTTGDELAR